MNVVGEIIFLGILFLACSYLFSLTFSFQTSVLDKSGGAALFPQIVIIFLLIFLALRIILILRTKEKKPFVFLELFQGMRLFFFTALVLYIIAIKPVGYVISTIIYLLIVINVFYYSTRGNWGNPKSILIRNTCIFAFVFLMNTFFASMLKVLLPQGFLA